LSRGAEDRVADVRRLLRAAGEVHAGRALIAGDIRRTTGLTAEGVELGFESLEREASDSELRALVVAAGHASRVHVILSANVFVAPLRAIALARAAADRVTIRPSHSEPVFTRALVEASKDGAIGILDERDIANIDADEIHVYGRDASIAVVRARAAPGTTVRGHGAGMGVAVVTRSADINSSAAALAADVVPFDQRGCLSPRLAIVEGEAGKALSFSKALHAHLSAWGNRVPRGELSHEEQADTVRWHDALVFAGQVWRGEHHSVALGPSDVQPVIAPPGRHVYVIAAKGWERVRMVLGHVARYVVAVGTDDPSRLAEIAPAHARVSALGHMQHPPLDGPVDRRAL
jgi:acyl-CoA reductase-like NAD-dependent aldehyde dehydrogenase